MGKVPLENWVNGYQVSQPLASHCRAVSPGHLDGRAPRFLSEGRESGQRRTLMCWWVADKKRAKRKSTHVGIQLIF